jgi:hypothetical protein
MAASRVRGGRGPMGAGAPSPLTKIGREMSEIVRNTLQLEEGMAVFEYPTELSAESYADFKIWLKRVERGIARRMAEEQEAWVEERLRNYPPGAEVRRG